MKRPPSRWWHAASALVFLVGAVGAPITMVLLMMGLFSSGEEFFVPGTHELKLENPGKYVVWNVESEFRDGQQYGFPNGLPTGTRIRVVGVGTGKEIPTEAAMHGTETSGSTKRESICTFTIPVPGSYAVIVDGMSDQRLLMVRHSMTASLLRLIFLGGVGCLLGWILAPLISVMVEVGRYRAKKEWANLAPPPGRSTE